MRITSVTILAQTGLQALALAMLWCTQVKKRESKIARSAAHKEVREKLSAEDRDILERAGSPPIRDPSPRTPTSPSRLLEQSCRNLGVASVFFFSLVQNFR